MSRRDLAHVEARILERLRGEPALVVDVADDLHLPLGATESLLHDLRQRGLVAVSWLGRPPVKHWHRTSGGDPAPVNAAPSNGVSHG